MRLAITIPAYNEEDTIESVITSIPAKIPHIREIKVFVIDNGSTDKTPVIAQRNGAELIRLGHPCLAKAFMAGIEAALAWKADIIVNIDADAQYRAEEIPELMQPILDEKADVVIGDRQVKKLKFMPPAKRYGNLAGSRFLRLLTGMKVKDATGRKRTIDASSGFRAFSANVANKFIIRSNHTYTHENLIQSYYLGLRIAQIPVTFIARKEGASRLITNVPGHILKSLVNIFKAWWRYKR